LKRGKFILVIVIFIILLIYPALAINSCCEQTNDGEFCIYTDESECDTNYQSAYATCEQTSYCQIGCCYSSDSGDCYKNTPKARCDAEQDAQWTASALCEIDQCTQGCCQIADQAFFVTEVKCKETASQYEGVSMNFDVDITTEYDCLAAVKNENYGCCVNDGEYTFIKREDCDVATTEVTATFVEEGFHENMLCSNDLLSGDCAKQQYTSCYQGKVYWYDSCGNRENIYSSDESSSYNNGYVLEESASCEFTQPNDPNCGNCDYAQGTVCGEDTQGIMPKGDYTCTDINCYDTYEDDVSPASGGTKLNGESWCIYDSFTGEALDTVGSRHYRHLCINGEEVVEPCTDFREQICIHGVLTADVFGTLEALNLQSNGEYIEAACRDNRYEECYDCNFLTEDTDDGTSNIIPTGTNNEDIIKDCCLNEDFRDCYWLEGEVERVERGTNIPLTKIQQEAQSLEIETTVGGLCVPQVPSGSQFWTEDGDAETASSNDICSAATRDCSATWRIGGWKKLFGGKTNVDNWNLVEETPGGCTERSWFVNQNTICKAQGDCGAYYNWLGDAGYDGFSSNAFAEAFFFDYDTLEEKCEKGQCEIGDWDYMVNVGGGEIKYYGPKSRYFYANPAFAIGITSATVGGIFQVATCSAAKEADLDGKYGGVDAGGLSSLMQLGGGAGGALNLFKGFIGGGGVVAVDKITGKVTLEEADKLCSDTYGEDWVYNTGSQRCSNFVATGEFNTYPGDPAEVGVDEEEYAYGRYEGDDDDGTADPEDETLTEEEEEADKSDEEFAEKAKLTELAALAEELGLKEQSEKAKYDKECEGVTAENNAELYQTCSSWAQNIATQARKDSTLDFTQGIGCFLQGATPIAGLIGRPVGKVSPQEIVDDYIGSDNPLTQLKGKAMQKAQSYKTVTRVSNTLTIAMAAYLVVEYIADNETTLTYTAECKMWQPPKGGDKCEECNTNEKPCSEYRCEALGAACELINQGSGNETCVSAYANDVNSPDVTVNEDLISDDYTITQTTIEGDPGFEINELIPAFTPVQLGLSTDEPATCKYATTPGVEYEDMIYDFGESLYLYHHALLLSLGDEVTQEEVTALTEGYYTIYVRCSDYMGNANERDYFIRFQVDDTPDLTAPVIQFTSVDEGTFFAYGVNQTSFSLYTNEPATCRWDVEDTGYDVMQYDMVCSTSGFESSSIYYGTYPCTTVLDGVTEDDINYYYFKCQDNSGNTNEDSYKYSTKASDDILTIESLEPSGEIYNNTITIEVETDGGAENGKAQCAFSTLSNDYNEMTLFYESNSSKHEQELTLYNGEFTLYVTCQDIAGNQATNSSEIVIETDETPPAITSFYLDEAFFALVLEMNEDSTCEYASEAFEYGEGTQMTGTMTTSHETSLGTVPIYYIICEDFFGNLGYYILDISLWS